MIAYTGFNCRWFSIFRSGAGVYSFYITDDFGNLVRIPKTSWYGVVLP